jgi:quercetin dioxygenase-like cupin family protein
MIKNMSQAEKIALKNEVTYQKGQVVSKTITKSKYVNMSLFAFDEGEDLSPHTSTGDALVTVLDGEVTITIGDEVFELKENDSIVMPANVLHAIYAKKAFKMLLVIVFEQAS